MYLGKIVEYSIDKPNRHTDIIFFVQKQPSKHVIAHIKMTEFVCIYLKF